MDSPNINQITPATGKQSMPSSGAYGEGADLANLEASLPSLPPGGQPPASQPQAIMPTVEPPQVGSPPPGAQLPPGLTAPTRHPDMPVSQPLTPTAAPFLGDPREQRIQLLHVLTTSPGVSADTKEWATTVLKWLIRTPQA
jgi:hypothetical protein